MKGAYERKLKDGLRENVSLSGFKGGYIILVQIKATLANPEKGKVPYFLQSFIKKNIFCISPILEF